MFNLRRHITAAAGSSSRASDTPTTVALMLAMLSLVAGIALLPGLVPLESVFRQWMAVPQEVKISPTVAGVSMVILAGAILSAYSMLKKGFNPDQGINGRIIDTLLGFSDVLIGERFRKAFQSSVFVSARRLLDAVIFQFAERLIADRLVSGLIERIVSFPVRVIFRSSDSEQKGS